MPQSKTEWVDFKAIKSQVTIEQVLHRYGFLPKLTRSGNGDRLSGACPIHGGSNVTHFRVSVSKNCWNCFGQCQCGGNVIDFVAKKENVSFRDAALLIKRWFTDEVETPAARLVAAETQTVALPERTRYSPPPTVDEVPKENAETGVNGENKPLRFDLSKLDPTHSYLRERGLTASTIETFGMGYCGKGLLRGYIAIPIHNADGELVAYAGRWPGTPPEGSGKYKLPQGFRKSLELFNQHRVAACDSEAPVVVVEGYFDALKLHQSGYERVVAIMGASLSEEQEAALCRLCESDGRVVLFLDNDESGRKGQADALVRLARHLYVHAVNLGSREVQPEHLSPDELRAVLPFPERRFP